MRSYSTSLASLSTASVPAPSPLLPRELGLPPRTEDLRTNGRAVSGQGLQPPGCSVGNGRGLPPGIPDRAPRAGRAMSAVCTASPRGPRETGQRRRCRGTDWRLLPRGANARTGGSTPHARLQARGPGRRPGGREAPGSVLLRPGHASPRRGPAPVGDFRASPRPVGRSLPTSLLLCPHTFPGLLG